MEIWRDDRLCGGLFGVALGGLFSSETMFHREPDAGNAALVAAAGLLHDAGFTLWDIQVASEHTMRFGAVSLSPSEYRRRLKEALEVRPLRFGVGLSYAALQPTRAWRPRPTSEREERPHHRAWA